MKRVKFRHILSTMQNIILQIFGWYQVSDVITTRGIFAKFYQHRSNGDILLSLTRTHSRDVRVTPTDCMICLQIRGCARKWRAVTSATDNSKIDLPAGVFWSSDREYVIFSKDGEDFYLSLSDISEIENVRARLVREQE